MSQSTSQDMSHARETGTVSLLEEITARTGTGRDDAEAFGLVQDQVQRAMREILKILVAGKSTRPNVDRNALDGLIAECDRRLSAQMDEILHHPEYQRLESFWRGLRMLVDRTDFQGDSKIRIDVLSARKEELIDDFEEAGKPAYSGLHKLVYTRHYGQHGGSPYGVMVTEYAFGPGSRDVALMRNLSAVAAMAHAPVIAAAGPEFFGKDSFTEIPKLGNLDPIVNRQNAKYAKWFGFRDSEDARYMGLTLPRVQLRNPYSPEESPDLGFDYRERVEDDHEKYLWGSAAFAFATRLSESFSKYGWCANIVGPRSGGEVSDLPIHVFSENGRTVSKIPTEILVPDRRDLEFSELGFIPLSMRDNSDNAAFFGANSVRLPRTYPDTPEGRASSVSEKLGSRLPYLFIVSRLAHYIKLIQRESIGSTLSTTEQFRKRIDDWLQQYVNRNDEADPRDFARRPLRDYRIDVSEVPGEAGWYRVKLAITPHFKYAGSYFELSLTGIDKQSDSK
jgi:type VI secretion system protein ImpC